MSRTKRILSILVENANIITHVLGHDSCIPATKIAIEVLERFGINAEPLTVTTTAWNDTFQEYVDRTGMLPQTQAERDACHAQGCWAIGCGFMFERTADGTVLPRDTKKWAGHLIVVTDGYGLDMAISQVSRPQYGMELSSGVCFEVPEGFSDKEMDTLTHVPQEVRGPVLLIYTSKPKNRSYLQTGGWNRREELRPFVDRLIHIVRTALQKD